MPAAGINFAGQMRSSSSIREAPVTFALIAISAIVFLLFRELGIVQFVPWFNFVPITGSPMGPQFGDVGQDWWRFITPTLLHFGWMHVVFNCLWIWEFGRRIEKRLGSLNLLGLYLVAGVASNLTQYMVTGPSIFGGMSGVVYGFLGFIWGANKVVPYWLESLPPAIFGFMMVWLCLGMVGVLEMLGAGAIANGAHVGGFLVGLAMGALFGVLRRLGGARG